LAKTIPMAEAKKVVLDRIAAGDTVEAAMVKVNRLPKSYENWRADDPVFRQAVNTLREQRQIARVRGVAGDARSLTFAQWRKQFLGQETYRHQQVWVDLLEGKGYTPVDGEKYRPGWDNRILINTPPYHAKSMTVTIEYVTYRVCMNPNIKIIIVSKTKELAKQFLYAVRQRLSSSQFAAIQNTYAPQEGFVSKRGTGGAWAADRIYVANRDDEQKDPTVQAIGMGQQIYGSRADLIICDDCVTLGNANQFEQQIKWINQEVSSRAKTGKILVIGTRVASIDLYSELINGDRYLSGKSPWTYLAQPAVLKYADDPDNWVTLWPESTKPLEEDGDVPLPNGMYRAWDGASLRKIREQVPSGTWSLVYMQTPVSEDSIFHPTVIAGCVERRRKPGLLKAGAWGHPRHGMEGQYVIGSMDPAMTGDTFTLVMAVDRPTQMRRVLQAWVQPSPTPAYIRNLIKDVTEEYGIHEWVIEQNAFQLFLVYDEEIQKFCQQRGVRITPHYSSRNKQDPDFGVASMAPLFGDLRRIHDGGRQDHDGNNLIELPDADNSEGVKALIEQLITWMPGKLGKDLKQDGPMALWFAELRARAMLGIGGRSKRQHFVPNPYLSRGDRRRQIVVPREAYRAAVEH
jgi:hypothetical protein